MLARIVAALAFAAFSTPALPCDAQQTHTAEKTATKQAVAESQKKPQAAAKAAAESPASEVKASAGKSAAN